MALLELVQTIVVGVLVGYLSFTNTLAERIEYFVSEPRVQVAQSEPTDTKSSIPTIPETSPSSRVGIPKILLEHKEFQRAALIASGRDEEAAQDVSGVPVQQLIKDALVNIYCQYKTDKYIRTTTGTGFFINSKGVILTNAHVAQFLLLEDTEDVVNDVDCVIRSGDPAIPQYKAELLYISPTWIFQNAQVIAEEMPRGTGERDYALLYISKSLNNEPLPTDFRIIPTDTNLLSRGTEGSSVVTAGYPAGALMRNGADAKLFPIVASSTVSMLYTFGSNYADIFSITETPVGEQGASGGPIVTADAHTAIGLIVTKGDEQTEGAHSLRALTLSYVDRTIIEETGFSLTQNMQGDVAYRGSIFKQAMVPFLAGILEDTLENAE